MKYIVLDTNNYGSSIIDLSKEEYNNLTDDQKSIIKEVSDNSVIDNYNWKKWSNEHNLWIEDLEKKAEIYFKNNPPIINEPEPIVEGISPGVIIAVDDKKQLEFIKILEEKHKKQQYGCNWNNYIVDSSSDSITMINSAVLMVNLNQWNNNSWKMKSGEFVSLTNEQVIDMALTVGNFIQSLFIRENELRTQIQNAITDEELVWEW